MHRFTTRVMFVDQRDFSELCLEQGLVYDPWYSEQFDFSVTFVGNNVPRILEPPPDYLLTITGPSRTNGGVPQGERRENRIARPVNVNGLSRDTTDYWLNRLAELDR